MYTQFAEAFRNSRLLLKVTENSWFYGFTHAAPLETIPLQKESELMCEGISPCFATKGTVTVRALFEEMALTVRNNLAVQAGGWSVLWVRDGNLPTVRRKTGEIRRLASRIRSRQRVLADSRHTEINHLCVNLGLARIYTTEHIHTWGHHLCICSPDEDVINGNRWLN